MSDTARRAELSVLSAKIRSAWPDHAARRGFFVPPVRENGATATLIGLAVDIADQHYRALAAVKEDELCTCTVDRMCRLCIATRLGREA